MDHLIGQRFNLISKSEIRYLGTLHEINPEDSTIALEDVYSFGTEDRKVDSFIPPSQHKFDYIVFRGGDVKDIKIAEEQKENKQPPSQNVLNDPAILNASRPGPSSQQPQPPREQSPFHPPGYHGPPPQFGGYYPPQQYGRGFGPPGPPPPGPFGPGPGFQGQPPYGPPPPGYFGPPGQGFPAPPQFPPQGPPPVGAPGQRLSQTSDQNQQLAQTAGPSQAPKPTSELPVDNKASLRTASKTTTPVPQADNQTPHTDLKSSTPASAAQYSSVPATAPTGPPQAPPTRPKTNKIAPAVPMTVNQKSFTPPVSASVNDAASTSTSTVTKPVPSQEAMEAASRQAKEAVAAAMAKLNPQAATTVPKPTSTAAAVEALTRKVGEIKTNDGTPRGGRGGYRGRGNYYRGGTGGQTTRKIEIPKSDYDFESANAKFNKEDMIKEAIASGSPIGETPDTSAEGVQENELATNGLKRKDSLPASTEKAYDKNSSFFDNISSEARDREESGPDRAQVRVLRGEEYKKNLETFGQGNVDGGYRGRGGRGYGRGRGGGYGYRGYGANRGFSGGQNRGNFSGTYRARGRGGGGAVENVQTSTAAS